MMFLKSLTSPVPAARLPYRFRQPVLQGKVKKVKKVKTSPLLRGNLHHWQI
jgi:hypothetical protein